MVSLVGKSLGGVCGALLNHDCHDGGKIAMIFPSLPLWMGIRSAEASAFVGMTG